MTGRSILAEQVSLSVQQVRTSLSKLKSTNEITIKSTNAGTLVTLVKYSDYQTIDVLPTSKVTSISTEEQPTSNQQVTSDQPASNQQLTTNKNVRSKECKNEKNEKKTTRPPKAALDFSPLCLTESQVEELKRIRKANKGGALSQRVVNGLAGEFKLAAEKGWEPDEILTEWETRGWKSIKAEWLDSKITKTAVGSFTKQDQQDQFRQLGFVTDEAPLIGGRVLDHE